MKHITPKEFPGYVFIGLAPGVLPGEPLSKGQPTGTRRATTTPRGLVKSIHRPDCFVDNDNLYYMSNQDYESGLVTYMAYYRPATATELLMSTAKSNPAKSEPIQPREIPGFEFVGYESGNLPWGRSRTMMLQVVLLDVLLTPHEGIELTASRVHPGLYCDQTRRFLIKTGSHEGYVYAYYRPLTATELLVAKQNPIPESAVEKYRDLGKLLNGKGAGPARRAQAKQMRRDLEAQYGDLIRGPVRKKRIYVEDVDREKGAVIAQPSFPRIAELITTENKERRIPATPRDVVESRLAAALSRVRRRGD